MARLAFNDYRCCKRSVRISMRIAGSLGRIVGLDVHPTRADAGWEQQDLAAFSSRPPPQALQTNITGSASCRCWGLGRDRSRAAECSMAGVSLAAKVPSGEYLGLSYLNAILPLLLSVVGWKSD
jgi:hypothetical protein